jgi:hypothetical protein
MDERTQKRLAYLWKEVSELTLVFQHAMKEGWLEVADKALLKKKKILDEIEGILKQTV